MSMNDGFKTATIQKGGSADKHASRGSTDGNSTLEIFQIKVEKNIIISQKFLKRILKCWLSHDELRKFQTLVAYYAMMYIDLQILFFCFKII